MVGEIERRCSLKTLLIIKPDWVENLDLLSELYNLLQQYNFHIIYSKTITKDKFFWEKFYIHKLGSRYYNEMVEWMSSSPSIFIVIEGDNVIDIVRNIIIGRNGSGLRGKYQISDVKNVAHTSDSETTATTEINLIGTSST